MVVEEHIRRRLNDHNNCFAFIGFNERMNDMKCRALDVSKLEECAKCKFFKTKATIKDEEKIVRERHHRIRLVNL